MPQTEIRLWPGVPDIAALGASSFEDLAGIGGGLVGEDRARIVRSSPGRIVSCLPLPGTPGEDGRTREAPRGAGTGWIYLTRYRGGSWAERARVRLSAPRSSSFAARDWNLICHLRQAGVGTPEPLAMGEVVGPLFSSTSFLVTRAMDSMRSLPEWLERHPGADDHRRAAEALGTALARLRASAVILPALEAGQLYLSSASAGDSPVEDDACAARKIAALVKDGAASPIPGTPFRRLPEVALGSVRGGGIAAAPSCADSLELLRRVARGLSPDQQPTAREAYRVFHHALGRGLPSSERRALWKQLRP